MIENLINDIEQAMLGVLNNEQMSQLRKVLDYAFRDINVSSKNNEECSGNSELIDSFLSAKRVEGCSDKSMHYYRSTLSNAIRKIEKNIRHITTDDLRNYLNDYQQTSGATKVTVDNIRRILSSFFAWLEDENYIVKSPARRIHKIRVSIQTNSLHGGMAFSIASSQDSFPVMGFCVYPRFSNNLSNKCPKSTQNTPVCNKTH